MLINFGWVLFRAGSLGQAGDVLSAMLGFAPGGLWSGEAEYDLRQYAWEWLIAVPAVLPVRLWLSRRLEFSRERGSALSAAALALCLLGLSAVRLLSSTFRSFLYFQF